MKVRTLHWKRAAFVVLLALLLSVAGVTNAVAQEFTVGNLNYSVNDDGISVTLTGHVDGESATGTLTILESVTYEGVVYPVTTIGENAFIFCSGLTGSLTIPNSVTTIGKNAFYNCSGFTGSLTIPNSVITIGAWAFCNCSGFTGNLVIPNSVVSIGGYYNEEYDENWEHFSGAFSGCSGFNGTLTLSNSLTEIGDYAFEGCSGLSGDLVIPNSVTSIGSNAFSDCYGFNGTLTLGNSITTICEYAFFGCSGFTGNLVIPNSVTMLGGYYYADDFYNYGDSHAFAGCSGFNGTLTLSNSLTDIGSGAFYGCSGFTGDLVIPVSVEDLSYWGYGTGEENDGAFEGCSGFTGNLTIIGATDIGANSFSGCSGFTGTLSLGYFIWSIGDNAFSGCEGFSSILMLGEPWWVEVSQSAFSGVKTEIPVYIGCGNLDDFLSDPAWSNFSNIQVQEYPMYPEDPPCLSTIVGVADPVTGGMVSGSGIIEGSTTLCATPNEGYTFQYWTIGMGNAYIEDELGNSCIGVEGYGAHVYMVAHFTPQSFVITATANPTESGIISGAGGYNGGATCTLMATANEGYTFVNWTENGNMVSTNPTYSFTVTVDRNLVANFVQTFPVITAIANPTEGGTIMGAGTYESGVTCTLTATPNEGYTFVNWTENGDVVSTENPYTFTVTGSRDLVANFATSGGVSYEFVELGLPSGLLWATCNVGADSPEDYGDYFAWGETQPKSVYNWDTYIYGYFYDFETGYLTKYNTNSNYGSVDNLTTLLPEDDAATANWGADWRMPTKEEWEELNNNTVCTWTVRNGVNGWLFSSSNGNSLFLPANGIRWGSELYDVGNMGSYWTSSLYSNQPNYAWYFYSYPSYNITDINQRDRGKAVRAVRFAQELSHINATANPAEGGTVTGSGAYEEGSICTLTATANEGYSFINWTENGNQVSTDPIYSFTVTGNRTLVANFMDENLCVITFDLYDSWGDGWTGNWLVVTDDNGGSYQLTMEDGSSSTQTLMFYNGSHVTLTWINGQYTYECSFTVSYSNGDIIYHSESLSGGFLYEFDVNCGGSTVSYNITAEANPADGGTVSGAGEYDYGNTCTLTATANEGFSFINWTENGTMVSAEATYGFTVTGNRELVANFTMENLPIPVNGLIAYYPFNGNANDESGNGNHGTLCGNQPQPTTDRFGNGNSAYLFGGYFNPGWIHVSNSTSLILDTEMSMSFWINLTDNNGMNGYGNYSTECVMAVVCKAGDGWATNPGFNTLIAPHSGDSLELLSFNSNNGSYDVRTSYHCYVPGQWMHCVVTVENEVAKLYINGVLRQVSTKDPANFYNANNHDLYIGIMDSYWYPFNGKIDDVALYNRALNAQEVGVLYGSEVTTYTIEALPNPVESGIIMGAGTYYTCSKSTLTATANDGYSFINWTENGTVVSTETTYSFIVTNNRNLVANFVEGDVCAITFDLYDSFGDGYTGNYLVVSYGDVIEQLTVESGSSASHTLAIPDGSHVVLTWIIGSYPEDCSFTVSYSSGEMIYEGSNLSSDFSYEFDVNCNGSSDITQTSNFSQGYNWWSTYIEQDGINGLEMLENSLGGNGVAIRSQASGYTDYYGEDYGWWGSLTSINNESSYRVVASTPCTVTMTGTEAVPSQHPITLNHGWTWMGYVPSTAMDVNAALANLNAFVGDMVKSQQGYADYYEDYGWYGSLNTIEPGMGLMYYSSNGETVTFTYPDNTRSEELKKNLTAENNHWRPNTFAYPDNMTVMAVVELNEMELKSDNYELAAFASNGECRGSIRLTYAEPLNRHVAFLTISGKDAAELSFRLYDRETGMEYYDAEESLDFVANAIVGEADDLYVVHFRGTMGMDEFASKLQIYPNPVNRGERFSINVADDVKNPVRVEIVNALGVETLRATSVQTPAQLTAPATAGVYTLRITGEGKGTVVRKLVVK